MIDLTTVSEIKNILNNKVINKIEDSLGNILYEAYKKLTGVPPLTITSKGQSLKNYKIYGNSRQNNLPDGYQEVEYISGNDSGYVPTNIYLNGNDIVKIKFKTLSSNIAFCLFGSYKANESDNFSVYIQSTYNSFFRYGDVNYRQFKAEPNTIYEIEMCADYLKINDETYYPFTTQTFTTRYPIYIGYINSSTSPKLKGIIYNFEIVGKARLLSCTRNSDGQIGMYDVMNNTFYPSSGTLTAGADVVPTPSEPIEIESVGDKSKNLFNIKLFNQNKVNGKRKDDNGNIVDDNVSNYSDYYISVKSNTQYTLYLIGQQGYYEYDENKNFTGRTVFSSVNTKTFTTSSTTKFIQIQYSKNNLDTTNAQLERGSTATSCEPYGYKIPITVSDGTNSSTTNIYLDEPLRKVGNYADYIDYKEQKVYRNVIVNDDSGEQTIENSYSGTTDTTGTSVTLPTIPSLVGTTIISVDTKTQVSSVYIEYK